MNRTQKNHRRDKICLALAAGLTVVFLLVGWWLIHKGDADPPADSSAPALPPLTTTEAPTTTTTSISTTTTTTAITTTTTATPSSTQTAPDFTGALFIGDSRTVGLMKYGGMSGASYFCSTGMSVYKIDRESNASPGKASRTLEQALAEQSYQRVYLMLGINELGYNRTTTINKYSDLVTRIRAAQPKATVYICANLKVGAGRSNRDSVVNNQNIEQFNQAIAALADGASVRYLDVNPIFDDGQGNLDKQYTSDNTHIYAKHYRTWVQWLEKNR